MDISAIKTVFYSPTQTSQKIALAICAGATTNQSVQQINLTQPSQVKATVAANELAIIAVPVYAGRVAPVARERLNNITGNNSPAILVVLYGNREFEDALIELKDIVEAQSFNVIAASAFIGEHSFATAELPIANDRPDEIDLSIAHDFGTKVMQKLTESQTAAPVTVPGNIPYKDGMPNLPFAPIVDTENCTQCEECLAVCPTGAIQLKDTIEINPEDCTFCCACIKTCPVTCITITNTPMAEKAEALHTNCQTRKEPELFI
ncbi:4Fe-4S binding protein [Desulforhopalus sp. 52FAK]